MEQRSVLVRDVQSPGIYIRLPYRWMRHFFTTTITPDNRVLVDLQRRACWIGLALLLQTFEQLAHLFSTLNYTYRPLVILVSTVLPFTCILGSFVAMWQALRPVTIKKQRQQMLRHGTLWQRLMLGASLILALSGTIVGTVTLVYCFLPPSLFNDGTSLDANADILLLHGRNPYTDSNILDVAQQFEIQPTWTTPLRSGQFSHQLEYPTATELQSAFDTALKAGVAPEFESKVSYPALAFLPLLPFVFFKHYNVLSFYFVCYLLIVFVSWKAVRAEMRPWVILLALANVPMWCSTLDGNLDIFYSLLLMLAWLYRSQRWLSILFFGLALASKQIAWFFIPFYYIYSWRTYSFKEGTLRIVLAGMVSGVINLPFILWNPTAWFMGVMAPMADHMFPMGVGIISFSVTHVLPYLPDWVYTCCEGSVLLAALFCYWRICLRRPEAAMLLAVIPIFFAWRSLSSYFYCAAYPLFTLLSARAQPGILHALVVSKVTGSLNHGNQRQTHYTATI